MPSSSHMLIAVESYGHQLNQYTDAVPSEESFAFATNLLDAFGRIFYNLKHTVFGAFVNFKRSELRYYVESHKVSVARVLANRVEIYRDLKVDIPHGMYVPYDQAVDLIQSGFNLIDPQKSMVTIQTTLAQLLKLADYDRGTQELKAATAAVGKISVGGASIILQKAFANKGGHVTLNQVPFYQVFESGSTLSKVSTKLLDMEHYYKDASDAHAKLQVINRQIDDVVETIKTSPNPPPKEFLIALKDFVYTSAVQFDMFGAFLHELQRVEHNFVLAFDAATQLYLKQ